MELKCADFTLSRSASTDMKSNTKNLVNKVWLTHETYGLIAEVEYVGDPSWGDSLLMMELGKMVLELKNN